jgi:ribosomal-protein-alanine N-acetyltransferase
MRESVMVRPAVQEDVETIGRLEAQLYPNPWFPATFRSVLKREMARILVADGLGRGVVGYAVFWWVHEQAELANLAVAKDFQGQGVGGQLLDRVLAEVANRDVETVFLEVRESNEAARRLYRSRGFSQISIRRDYYRNPREDALILVKPVEGDEVEETLVVKL